MEKNKVNEIKVTNGPQRIGPKRKVPLNTPLIVGQVNNLRRFKSEAKITSPLREKNKARGLKHNFHKIDTQNKNALTS